MHSTLNRTPHGTLAAPRVTIPFFGHIARDVRRDVTTVFYLLTIALTALVLAVQTFGLAALVMAALGAVPVIFILLLWVTLP